MSNKEKGKGNVARGVIVSVLALAVVIGGMIYLSRSPKDKPMYITSIETKTTPEATTEAATKDKSKEEETTENNRSYNVTMLFAGDDLISDNMLDTSKNEEGQFDFSSSFKNFSVDIMTTDFSCINQESIIGGADRGFSGYPNFNSPDEVGNAIADAGFDVVLCANNHSLDMGLDGIRYSVKYWKDKKNIAMTGIYDNLEDSQKITVVNANNIKIAVLNYTFGLNGHWISDEDAFMINMLDKDRIAADIEKAKKEAEFIVVCPHWGEEYSYEPSDEQRELAQFIADCGANLIVGTHPHVLQPVEWITSGDRKVLCYYSLGNFISGQERNEGMLGGLAKLSITKDKGKISIDDGAGIVPVVTHFNWDSGEPAVTYRLSEYTEELAQAHTAHERDSDFTLSSLNDKANEVVGDFIISK